MFDSQDLENHHDQVLAQLKEAEAQLQLKRSQTERIAKLPLPKEFWHAQTELAAAQQKARYQGIERERYKQLLDAKLTSVSEFEARKLADELAAAELTNAMENVRVVSAAASNNPSPRRRWTT